MALESVRMLSAIAGGVFVGGGELWEGEGGEFGG